MVSEPENPEIDFQHSQAVIPDGMPDIDVLALAASEGRALVSHDFKTMPRHFREFVRKRASPGVILIPQRLPIGVAIEELRFVWECGEERDFVNQVMYLPL